MYYEFKFFIYTHLIHARKKQKSVYRDIVSNRDFIRAFNVIDAMYGALIDRVAGIEKDVERHLSARGLYMWKNGPYTYIGRTPGSGTGRSNFSDTVEILHEELKKEIYATLAREVFSR